MTAVACRPPRARFATRRQALAGVTRTDVTAFECDCGFWHLTVTPQPESDTQ